MFIWKSGNLFHEPPNYCCLETDCTKCPVAQLRAEVATHFNVMQALAGRVPTRSGTLVWWRIPEKVSWFTGGMAAG